MLLRLGKANGISAITQKYVGAQSKSPTMFSISSLAFWLGASTTHIKRVTCKHLFGMPWVYFKKKMHNMQNSFTICIKSQEHFKYGSVEIQSENQDRTFTIYSLRIVSIMAH